jgi:uncharacterized protein (DUF2141 family)
VILVFKAGHFTKTLSPIRHFTQVSPFHAAFQDPHEMALAATQIRLHGLFSALLGPIRSKIMTRTTTTISAIIFALTAAASCASANPAAPQATAPQAIASPVAATTNAAPATPHTLTVTVTGVRSSQGQIRASLLKADYSVGNARQAGAIIVAANQGTTTLTFPNLADGDYAVQMFHDEDGDGEMKTNLFGIPSEGYGFSNNARASFGPPKFHDMKVSVTANTTTPATMAY